MARFRRLTYLPCASQEQETILDELLSISESFKTQVTKEPNLAGLRRQAVIDGMRPLRLAGALRVAEGVTTIEEVLSATPPVE